MWGMKASYYILPSYVLIQYKCFIVVWCYFFKLGNEKLIWVILNVVVGCMLLFGLRGLGSPPLLYYNNLLQYNQRVYIFKNRTDIVANKAVEPEPGA